MAKNYILIIYVLLTCGIGSGCLHKNSGESVSDTPPGTEINEGPVFEVLPINDAKPTVDTVSVKTETITNSNPKKKDTVVKTIIVEKNTKIDYVAAVQKVYLSYEGVREATGKNDGPKVEMFLKSTGLGKGNPWCAAFVHFCLERGGVKNTITAWSPTSFNKSNIVWHKNKSYKAIQPADVFSLYYPGLGRIGHTGFVNRDRGNGKYESMEGNTGGQGVREGDGVYKMIRTYSGTYAISRWIK
jgi:hypothetical protein